MTPNFCCVHNQLQLQELLQSFLLQSIVKRFKILHKDKNHGDTHQDMFTIILQQTKKMNGSPGLEDLQTTSGQRNNLADSLVTAAVCLTKLAVHTIDHAIYTFTLSVTVVGATYSTVLVFVEDLGRECFGIAREVSHLLLGLF